MSTFGYWFTVGVVSIFFGVLGAVILISSITTRPEAVPLTTSTSVLTPMTIEAEIIDALVITSVCDDFDNGLWFWDMYAERSQGLTEDETYALMLAMSNEVHTDCLHHQNRLPSELLGD